MKIFILFFFLIQSSFLSATTLETGYFQAGCLLFDYQGKFLKSFPGYFCIFLDDGRVISANERRISMLGLKGEVEWSIEDHHHHQINLSPDGKRILALGSSFVPENGEIIRYDKFVIYSLDGKVIHQNTIKDLGKDFLNMRVGDTIKEYYRGVKWERSHFNSIFEVPPLKKPSSVAWIKEGNVVVNSFYLGIYVLTPDLSKVLHHFKPPQSLVSRIHDVQVLENGNILLFNNAHYKVNDPFRLSALLELDPLTMKPLFTFTGEEGIPLYSRHCGGVQKLDENFYVFSTMVNGTYIYSKREKKVVRTIHEMNHFQGLMPLQNPRLIWLSEQFKKTHL